MGLVVKCKHHVVKQRLGCVPNLLGGDYLATQMAGEVFCGGQHALHRSLKLGHGSGQNPAGDQHRNGTWQGSGCWGRRASRSVHGAVFP